MKYFQAPTNLQRDGQGHVPPLRNPNLNTHSWAGQDQRKMARAILHEKGKKKT